MTSETYHDGERLVQARARVTDRAAKLAGMVRGSMPPAAQTFLAEREMLVVGSVGCDGRVWASLLAAAPGFARALDERTVRINSIPTPSDPLAAVLRPGNPAAPVGLLAIDFATRRRMRLNGTARLAADGWIEVHTQQVYSNCAKYIQAKSVRPLARAQEPVVIGDSHVLSPKQRRWVEEADTFFIATAHPTAGVDASHRGGNPGFVHADDTGHIGFPDYAGNNMFNTLGNIAVNPAAGLLFLDFASGRTLQVTGTASVGWDGAARRVCVRVARAVETGAALPHRYNFLEASPFNPAGFCDS